MAKKTTNRRLTAIMFTDIVGYTALMQKDEAVAAKVRAQHREVFQSSHEQYHGEILQYYGDGTLSVFQSGVEAVECAIGIQQALQREEPVPLRIGVHIGDIVFDGTEVYGDGVNTASRIESMGLPGTILLSGALNEELKNHPQVSTLSLGLFEFKNIAQPIEVFAVSNTGIVVPKPSELKGKQNAHAKTIAVLPFVNMSSHADTEYFSDGMTEEIINALAKIKPLKVTSRTSSFSYKGKNVPLPQIGKELNVSTILEGSVRLAGNKMRITAQLIDVREDYHFWSETFDRSIEDVFAVQDEISLLIADKLREHIGHFEVEDQLVEAPGIPVEVYQQYLKARYHLMKLDLPGTEQAIDVFTQVIEKAPSFPLPYLGVNQGYAFLGAMGMLPAAEAFAKAKPFLEKAIELGEDLPEVQLNLSWDACWQQWDFPTAYGHILKAIETRPSDEMYLTLSNILTIEGKFDAAYTYIDKALQLDPFSGMNHHYKGFLHYLTEQYEAAIPFFEKSLQLKPDLPFPHLYWGLCLLLMGRNEEGMAWFQQLPKDETGELTKSTGLTLGYLLKGDLPRAKQGMQEIEAALHSDSMGRATFVLIMCHTLLQEYDKAIDMIEAGIANRLPLMLLLYTEPILKPLRSLPRFQEFMQGIYGTSTTFDVSERKYKKSLFDIEELELRRKQLETLMREVQPYLDPKLNLRDLAQQMDIPPNHLSQLLNEGFDKNFAEYVNAYRLESFKTKVADPSLRHMTLLALAYDSGFNSKTVFNTYFKKAMGKTPKAYWREVVG